MMRDGAAARVGVRLARPNEKAQLRAMLADYLGELAAFGGVDTDYPYLDAYWTEPDVRWPYLLLTGEAVCGFALVRSPAEPETDFSMAEFFIMRFARRRGFGIAAAAAIMQRHPGRWELSLAPSNRAALSFWPAALAGAGAAELVQSDMAGRIAFHFIVSPPQRP